MNNDFNHAESLGKLLSNLLSLEFLARAFLAKKYNQEEFPGDNHKKGDFVTLNFLTNYYTLSKVIKKYNEHVKKKYRIEDERLTDLIDLRDCLAHGRILTNLQNNFFKLFKFSRPGKNDTQVEITHLMYMDKNWFSENILFVKRECDKIINASKEETLDLIPN